MTQFAMQSRMHDITINSLKHALFDEGEFEVEVSKEYTDVGLDWSIKENLSLSRKMEANEGLVWDGNNDASGTLWGGCVESLIVQSSTAKYLPQDDDLEDTILFIETAEDIPEHWIIEYLLTGFGERGWFDKFQAVLVGRPKAWEFNKQNDTDAKAEYSRQQRETILSVVREYNQDIPVVQNIDFGHSDPQLVIPSGRIARLDNKSKKLSFTY